MNQQNNYRNYEYLNIMVNNKSVNETVNRYASLGWEIDRQDEGFNKTTLTFRRERSIKNKEQLNRLQIRIEDGANGIKELERSKKKGASIFAGVYGSIAAVIFGGGMSLVMFSFDPVSMPAVIGGIALGVFGGVLAALTYPIFQKAVKKKTAKVNTIIEKKRDEIADLCQEAHGLSDSAVI